MGRRRLSRRLRSWSLCGEWEYDLGVAGYRVGRRGGLFGVGSLVETEGTGIAVLGEFWLTWFFWFLFLGKVLRGFEEVED